jgi:hypothetical protein
MLRQRTLIVVAASAGMDFSMSANSENSEKFGTRTFKRETGFTASQKKESEFLSCAGYVAINHE